MPGKKVVAPKFRPRSWKSYEVFEGDPEGEYRLPFSVALAGGSGRLPKQAITKMLSVEDRGWPAARRDLKDDLNRRRIVRKDDVVWMLKCTPNPWRLYFYVWDKTEPGKIIYLHAIWKKQDEEDASDALHARSVYENHRASGSRIWACDFPLG